MMKKEGSKGLRAQETGGPFSVYPVKAASRQSGGSSETGTVCIPTSFEALQQITSFPKWSTISS